MNKKNNNDTPCYTLLTGQAKSAISLVAAHGPVEHIENLLHALNVSPTQAYRLPVIKNLSFKEVVIARPNENTLWLMPPGGKLSFQETSLFLEKHGFKLTQPKELPWQSRWPEAQSGGVAAALEALSIAKTDRATDAILGGLNAWQNDPHTPWKEQEKINALILEKLINPPLVALIGPPNIGKSALTNALANDQIANVCDEIGTTRDAIEVELELDGLVVRWLDTPGQHEAEDPIDQSAIAISNLLVESSDLVIEAIDSSTQFKDLNYERIKKPDLIIATRTDLGESKEHLQTSSKTGEGIAELAIAIRKLLVPDSILDKKTRWPAPL